MARQAGQPAAPLWSALAGEGSPVVVFEAGGGEHSAVWAEVEREVRRADGVRTLVYDRAGLGRSAPAEPPYRIEAEADALRRVLDQHGIAHPVVLVAHSYGGFVATLVAALDRRIAAVVLVDANLPAVFDEAQLQRIHDTYVPQFPALRATAPELARVMIPLMEAYPATIERVRQADIPHAMPVIDIVAERTWVESPEELSAYRRAHEEFVAASPQRQAVFAAGSGHHVMRDRPEIVLAAVAELVTRVREAAAGV